MAVAAQRVTLTLPTGNLSVLVRRSVRARRVALKIDPDVGGVALILPERVPLSVGLDFLKSRADWVASRYQALPPQIPFSDGEVIPVLGVPHRIRHLDIGRQGRNAVIAIVEDEIRVAGQTPHVARRVRDHLTELARQELVCRARAHAAVVGREIGRITIRDTRSRWGSCAASGNLSFSWRLVFAPLPVLDYVAAHEVAHLVHMNHGAEFWRVVARLTPGWQTHRNWLRANRAVLMRYG